MGDKGGKKDKSKSQKQIAQKHDKKDKKAKLLYCPPSEKLFFIIFPNRRNTN